MISTEIVCVLALVIVATAKPRAERDAGSALIELIQRQAEGNSTTSVPGLLDYLKNFLEESQAEIKSLKKKLRASKKELEEKIDGVKTDLANVKAKQIRCHSGWSLLTPQESKQITFSSAFTKTPSFMAALYRFSNTNTQVELRYDDVTPTKTGATIKLESPAAGTVGTYGFTWMACGN